VEVTSAIPVRLPPLRQELTLQPAPAAPDGAPTWTLHDPAANRFFQLGWPAFEIL
jgi:putative peptide zinc metalloprotease protein